MRAPAHLTSTKLQRERPLVAGPERLGHAALQNAPRAYEYTFVLRANKRPPVAGPARLGHASLQNAPPARFAALTLSEALDDFFEVVAALFVAIEHVEA